MFNTACSVGIAAALALAGSGTGGGEQRVQLKNLPAAVQATVKAETQDAVLKGLSRETENGHVVYEVETAKNGKSRDLLVDASGSVVEVEEQIAVTDAPAAVQTALSSAGTLKKLERVTRGGVTYYEAHVTKSGKAREIQLDADGKPHSPK